MIVLKYMGIGLKRGRLWEHGLRFRLFCYLLKARTPLEQEIFNLLHKNKQPVTDPLLTPVEKASLKAMSLEEVSVIGPLIHPGICPQVQESL